MSLTLEETETHLNMTASDRSFWEVYSDDPVMQKRLEKVGATLVRVNKDGIGRHYTLSTNQVTIRKPIKPMSEERKAKLGDHMRALHSAKQITSAKTPKEAS